MGAMQDQWHCLCSWWGSQAQVCLRDQQHRCRGLMLLKNNHSVSWNQWPVTADRSSLARPYQLMICYVLIVNREVTSCGIARHLCKSYCWQQIVNPWPVQINSWIVMCWSLVGNPEVGVEADRRFLNWVWKCWSLLLVSRSLEKNQR